MPFYSQGIKAVEQPGELAWSRWQHLGLTGRPANYLVLQALLPQAKAVAIPVEQLDDAPATVTKAKQMPDERIELHLPRDQDGQAIEGFTHIRGAQGQILPSGKFSVNELFFQLGVLINNMLQVLAESLLDPGIIELKGATRHRLRTIMQWMMYLGGRFARHARRVVVKVVSNGGFGVALVGIQRRLAQA